MATRDTDGVNASSEQTSLPTRRREGGQSGSPHIFHHASKWLIQGPLVPTMTSLQEGTWEINRGYFIENLSHLVEAAELVNLDKSRRVKSVLFSSTRRDGLAGDVQLWTTPSHNPFYVIVRLCLRSGGFTYCNQAAKAVLATFNSCPNDGYPIHEELDPHINAFPTIGEDIYYVWSPHLNLRNSEDRPIGHRRKRGSPTYYRNLALVLFLRRPYL